MKVLGLVASDRVLGNSEVLAKEAARPLLEAGVQVRLLRITDLEIRSCIGCMRCVFRGARCPVEDDAEHLFDLMLEADGLILSAPTYVLEPAAIIKAVVDRFLMLALRFPELNARPRYGVSISCAGIEGWNPLGVPLLNKFLLAFRYRVVGSLEAYAPGPGQILLDEAVVSRAADLGRALAGVLAGEATEGTATRGTRCPVCHGTSFELLGDGRVRCPLCRVLGRIVDQARGVVEFEQDSVRNHRWADEPLREHVENWILKTEGMFRERAREIRARAAAYRELDHLWLAPPERQDSA